MKKSHGENGNSHEWRFLKQIEIWFSTLAGKVIRREDFCSVGDLEDEIIEFIEYHNEHLARPYAWMSRCGNFGFQILGAKPKTPGLQILVIFIIFPVVVEA